MLFKFRVTSCNSGEQTAFCYSHRTEQQRLAGKWSYFSSAQLYCLQENAKSSPGETKQELHDADKKYYPLVAMTLACSSAVHGGTVITFLGYTRKPTACYFTLLFQTVR